MVLPEFIDPEFLRNLFFATPDALILCDGEGKIVLVNEHAYRLFGFDRDELSGRPVEMLIPELFRASHPRQRAQYFDNPSVRPMGLRRSVYALHKLGMEIPVEISLSSFSKAQNKYVLVSVRDVTEQRQMEAFIRDSNVILARLAAGAALAEVLTAVLVFVEARSADVRCCVLRHDTADRRLSVESAPSLSAGICKVLNGWPVKSGVDLWSEAVFHGKSTVVTDTTKGAYQAEFAPLAAFGVGACWSEPIRDSDNNLLGTFVAFCKSPREPSSREAEMLSLAAHMAGIGMERDHRNRQLQDQEQRLREKRKLEAIGSLTGGIAHEFNNLLQSISAYTDFALAGAILDGQVRQDLVTVRTAATRATSITRQLLSFCRRHPMDQRIIDLNRIVDETCELLRPLLGENIELRVNRSKKSPEVTGDSGQLQQMLINLCINARDAMPEGGVLSIETKAASVPCGRPDCTDGGDSVILVVQDNGCGMTAELKDRIFEPFFTTKELGKGTGLGLPVVYGIVRQHGGDIDVETALGQGTTFRILFPPANGAVKEHATVERASQITHGSASGETILVAEDDEAVRHALSRILENAGYLAVLAENGEEAVRLFKLHRSTIRLAVLDVVMPKRSGRWAGARIRELSPGFPLLFCTGYDPETASEPTSVFPDAVTLVKPVERDRLLTVVRTMLDQVLVNG